MENNSENDIGRQQEVAARVEGDRFDHEEIEAGNRAYIDQVKVMRHRHRKNERFEGLGSEDSDIDDAFRKELVQAANKHGYKRKKKHMFTDDGVEIEPFHLRNDIKEGLLTADGFIKTSLRDFDRKKELEAVGDAWLDSEQVVEDQ